MSDNVCFVCENKKHYVLLRDTVRSHRRNGIAILTTKYVLTHMKEHIILMSVKKCLRLVLSIIVI